MNVGDDEQVDLARALEQLLRNKKSQDPFMPPDGFSTAALSAFISQSPRVTHASHVIASHPSSMQHGDGVHSFLASLPRRS